MAITAIDALKMIEAELAGRRAEAVPLGWRSAVQWIEESGRNRSVVDDLLRDGVRSGLMERKQFKVSTGQGVRSVWHYRLIPEAPWSGKKNSTPDSKDGAQPTKSGARARGRRGGCE